MTQGERSRLSAVLVLCPPASASRLPSRSIPAPARSSSAFEATRGPRSARQCAPMRAPTSSRRSRCPGCSSWTPRPACRWQRQSRGSSSSEEVLYAEPDAIRSAARRPNDPYFSSSVGPEQDRLARRLEPHHGQLGGHGGSDRQRHGRRATPTCPRTSAATRARPAAAVRPTAGMTTATGMVDDVARMGLGRATTTTRPTRTATAPTSRAQSELAATTVKGVAGVAWQVKLMPLRVLDANNQGSISDVVAAYALRGLEEPPDRQRQPRRSDLLPGRVRRDQGRVLARCSWWAPATTAATTTPSGATRATTRCPTSCA